MHSIGLEVGPAVAEGKTKQIVVLPGRPGFVLLVSKDDITAGDGTKHDVIPDKGRLANSTACNVFSLLKACGLPVAFESQYNATAFLAPYCRMLPYEVVIRREAHGSYLKRNLHLNKGHLFPRLLVEFFLKTSGKNWKGKRLDADDPLMSYKPDDGVIKLYNPAKLIVGQDPFLVLGEDEVFTVPGEHKHFSEMKRIARLAFLALEKAWQLEGRTLVDMKVEFGIDPTGQLLLADVIDNDSWRVVENGGYIDKQVYRDGGHLSDVADKYRHVANLTTRFRVPPQRIILWCGSDTDKIEPFDQVLDGVIGVSRNRVTCSVHKQPVQAIQTLQRITHETPDCVVIAYIGRSNGAGPTLSACVAVPVITVPAGFKEFPEDVWSSLRGPSSVPVMTVLEPTNAVLAALNILSARNPALYAKVRYDVESRMVNMVAIT